MNTSPRLAARAARPAFAASLLLLVASTHAQTASTNEAAISPTSFVVAVAQQATPRPTATPEKTKPNSATATAQEPAQPKTAPLTTPRDARARAYAKLLEGQRYLSRAKGSGSVTRDSLTAMQEAFRQAAALDPTLAEAHTALAEVAFFFLDDTNEAEQEARLAVRVDPDNFGAHRILSRIYALRAGIDESKFKREDGERAIAELKEVLRLDPTDAEALALIGEFYHLTGRENEAIDAFRRWVGAPATVETQFYQIITQGGELTTESALAHLAQAQLRAGRAKEAIATIRQALAADPGNHEYLELLTEAATKGGDPGVVIDELKRLADANPADAEAANALAQAQARAGKTDDAAATLRAAIARSDKDDKKREALTVALAGVLADALRYDEAIAAYNDLLKSHGVTDAPLVADSDKQFAGKYLEEIIRLQRLAGRDSDAMATVTRMRRLFGANDLMAEFYSIDLLREQGKREEALAAARAAREKYPENPSLLRLEATILAESGRVDEAATLLRSRLNGTFENDYQVNAQIAQMYIEANRGKEAVEAAQKLLQMTPQESAALQTQSLVLLSSAQERAGDFKGAEESLRKILARDPDSAIALNNLGYFLTEHDERLKEALDMIQRAVKSEPTNASYLDSLGWVYFKLGQLDDAERYLTEASRRNPRSSTIQEHVGDILARRGKQDEARAAWRKALSLTTEPADTARLRAKIGGDARH